MIRFRKFDVEKCPQQQSTWDEAASRLNCSVDKHGHNTYHCVPEQDKSSLVEFCYDRLTGRFEKGKCIHLSNSGFLNNEKCSGILPGCPQESYLSNQIFKYPDCQNINTVDRCFAADLTCPNKFRDVTTVFVQSTATTNSTNELSFNNRTTFSTNIDNELGLGTETYIGIAGGLIASILTVLIIVYFLRRWRRDRRRGRCPEYIVEERMITIDDIVVERIKTFDDRYDKRVGYDLLIDRDFMAHELSRSGISRNELCVLYTLLLSDDSSVLVDSHFLELYDSVQGIYIGQQSLSKEGVFEIIEKGVLEKLILRTYEKIEFRRKGYRSLTFLNMMNDISDNDQILFFIQHAPTKIIEQYCRSKAYKGRDNEIFIRFPDEYFNVIIENLQLDIIRHLTIEDDSIHENVLEILNLKIPKEVFKWDQDSRSKYVEQMKNGSEPIFLSRGMIIGCAAAGKTTFLKRLQGEDAHQISSVKSTVGLEIYDDMFIVDDIKKTLLRDVGGENTTRTVIKGTRDKKKSKLSRSDRDHHSSDVLELLPLTEEENTVETENCTSSLMDGRSKQVDHKKTKKYFSMHDFGGQCAYYACHQIYLTYRAIYFIVVDMSKSLKSKVDAKVCDQEGLVYEDWTYADYFLFWLKSVHTYCESDTPVFIIATHSESKSHQERKQFLESLLDLLPPKWSLNTHLDPRRYFAIGFGEDNLEYIKECVATVLSSQKTWGEHVPIKWAYFEDYIKTNRVTMKMMKIFDIPKAISSNPNSSATKLMLRFFHDIGRILYFDEEALQDVIIIDIQWFVDAFKNIITDTNHVRSEAKKSDWDEYFNTGELPDDILVRVWKKEEFRVVEEQKQDILSYMQRLGLLVKATSSESHYIPCMNKKTFGLDQKKIIKNSVKKTSILFFDFDFLPHFFFYRLVVALIITKDWEIIVDGTKCVYKNAAVFRFKRHHIVLCFTQTFIQLQVFLRDNSMKLHHPTVLEIRDIVLNRLNDITKTFHTEQNIRVGYTCKDSVVGEDMSHGNAFIEEKEILYETKIECPRHGMENEHLIDCRKTTRYWVKRNDMACTCFLCGFARQTHEERRERRNRRPQHPRSAIEIEEEEEMESMV